MIDVVTLLRKMQSTCPEARMISIQMVTWPTERIILRWDVFIKQKQYGAASEFEPQQFTESAIDLSLSVQMRKIKETYEKLKTPNDRETATESTEATEKGI